MEVSEKARTAKRSRRSIIPRNETPFWPSPAVQPLALNPSCRRLQLSALPTATLPSRLFQADQVVNCLEALCTYLRDEAQIDIMLAQQCW